LEQCGYLAWSASAWRDTRDDALLGVGRVARHTFEMDWTRTRAFATTPTSNGIYLTAPGNAHDECLALRQRIADDLWRLRDPETGQPIVRRIYTKEEAFAGPFCDLAPDLTLELQDGGLVSILPSARVLTTRPAVAGAHRPVGVFLAKGPGIRHGVLAPELSILDVAPTVLYSLGLDVTADLEGEVPESIFEPGVVERQPVVRRARSSTSMHDNPRTPVLDAAQEAIIMRRLQELGYVE
jgi:predicted AlkP superfamily phosphohydrolase/phosphomutase